MDRLQRYTNANASNADPTANRYVEELQR